MTGLSGWRGAGRHGPATHVRGLLVILAGAVAVLAVGVSLAALTGLGAAPPAGPPATSAAAPSAESASDSSDGVDGSPGLPSDAVTCPGVVGGRSAAAGSPVTDCGFAGAVLQAWASAGGRAGTETSLQVEDPLTGAVVPTTCVGELPVVCLAEINRIVYLH